MASFPSIIVSLESLFPQIQPSSKEIDVALPDGESTFPAAMFAALITGDVEISTGDSLTVNATKHLPFTSQAELTMSPEISTHAVEHPSEDALRDEQNDAVSSFMPTLPLVTTSPFVRPTVTTLVQTQPQTAIAPSTRTPFTSVTKTELPLTTALPATPEVAEPTSEVAFAALLQQVERQRAEHREEKSAPHPQELDVTSPNDNPQQSPKVHKVILNAEKLLPTSSKPASDQQTPSKEEASVGQVSPATPTLPRVTNESGVPAPLPAPVAPFATAKAPSPSKTNSVVEPVPVPLQPSALDAPRPVHQLSLRVESETAQTADIRMVEQNGEIKVMVRASDPVLANTLRSDLSELASRLAHHELATEIWHPSATAIPTSSNSGSLSSGSQDEGAPTSLFEQSGGDHRQQHSSRERRNAPSWFDDLEHASAQRPQRKERK